MTNTGIPSHYTASPSSLSGTPFLTINKDATEGLDSTNAFEGPEKLLEVWFSPSANVLPASARPNGLKAVSAETWKGMLDLLSESSMFVFPHKLVLKTCGTTTLLLGLPRMLEIAGHEAGFPSTAGKLSTSASPHRVFYSRKNFLFPDKQMGPHRSWRDEVHYLDKQFPGGSAYMIGKMNGEHWYLYITSPNMEMTPPLTPEEEKADRLAQHAAENGLDIGELRQLKIDPMSDETLEILMTDLEPENARQFYLEEATRLLQADAQRQAHEARLDTIDRLDSIPEHTGKAYQLGHLAKIDTNENDATFDVFAKQSLEMPNEDGNHGEGPVSDNSTFSEGHLLGAAVSENCGLSDVFPVSKYPDARVDAYFFTPCGFSANGVIPDPRDTKATHYFTVHVTPEPFCSYASFETNVPARQSGRETADLVTQVVNIFKPGRFSVTLFEAKSEDDGHTKLKKGHRMDDIPGYKRVDRVLHDLEGYELVFRHFERVGFKGGRPRIGEQ